MPMALPHIYAVSVGSNFYVFGGSGEEAVMMLKFDTERGTWSTMAPLHESITRPAICSVGSDIYVFGGYNSEGVRLASVFEYDTVIDVWSTLAPMPQVCSFQSAGRLDGRVYIMNAGVSWHATLCFDVASGVRSTLAPTTFHGMIATFILSGCLYVVETREVGSCMERYDVATDTWTAIADLLQGRRSFGAIGIESVGAAEEQDLFDSLIAEACIRRS
jgi:hypothetical protein